MSACNVGDPGLIPGLGRSPGEGNGNPLQYYCLENPMDEGAWWVHRVAKSWTRLSDFTFKHSLFLFFIFSYIISFHALYRILKDILPLAFIYKILTVVQKCISQG